MTKRVVKKAVKKTRTNIKTYIKTTILSTISGVLTLTGYQAVVNFTDNLPSVLPQQANHILQLLTSIGSKAHADTDGNTPPYDTPDDAILDLNTLPVKGKGPLTGYSHGGRVKYFGKPWTDDTTAPLGHNGCDTRNDILARDMTDVHYRTPKSHHHSCKVTSGILVDPYSGRIIHFHSGSGRNRSMLVQIDHLVPLANAWQTGAFKLTQQQREALANDPRNLLAVEGDENQQKGDKDASGWLPKNKRFRIKYVEKQIWVKVHYHLWVTPSEKQAMLRILNHS